MTTPPVHLLRLQPARAQRDSHAVRIVTRTDVHWGVPIFRAASFPTVHQLSSELPFTTNFQPRVRSRA